MILKVLLWKRGGVFITYALKFEGRGFGSSPKYTTGGSLKGCFTYANVVFLK